MNLAAVVLAAGRGARFGGEKHAIRLAGKPLWQWSVELFSGLGIPVTLVGSIPGGIPGGERRRDSVFAGLNALAPNVTHVLIHDAARPLASQSLVERVVGALEDGAKAVIPAVPVTDTIKRVADGSVVGTVDRSELWWVQTPQGFELRVLREAHALHDDDVSDDASLVEALGVTVRVVEGDQENRKITYRVDHFVAEATLSDLGDADA